MNPDFIIKKFEDKTPSLYKRLHAIKTLQKMNWNVGLRFDPLIWEGTNEKYKKFFENVFHEINLKRIHSVTIGDFRMPSSYLKKISNIRQNDYFLQLENSRRLLGSEINSSLVDNKQYCVEQISKFIDKDKIFLN